MKAIGGYFELADREDPGHYPVNGIRLNTSRNALEYIIRSLYPDIKHVYLPLYTCEAVIEPFNRINNVNYSFYHINDKFEISDEISLQEGEYLIANNYFGLKDAYLTELAHKYGNRLIIDNAQALFFSVPYGIKAIYSPRKYLGVADGGFAVGVDSLDVDGFELDDATAHDSHLITRKIHGAEAGFMDYQENELKLDNQPIRRMAPQTQDILLHIDYQSIIAKRKENYSYIQNAIGGNNQLDLPENESFVCPMVYPFLCGTEFDLRRKLITNKVYIARYWSNVLDWAETGDFEYLLATHLLPLPVDQRYGKDDMERVIDILIG